VKLFKRRVDREERRESLHTPVAKPKGGGALPLELEGLLEPLESFGSDVAVMAERFDLEHLPIGGKADLAQGVQIVKPPTPVEVVGVKLHAVDAFHFHDPIIALDLGHAVG